MCLFILFPSALRFLFFDETASVILLGDSHLTVLGLSIQKRLYDSKIGSYAASYDGCIPVSGLYLVSADSGHQCDKYNQSMIDYARRQVIRSINLIGRFPLYLNGNRYDSGEGGAEAGEPAHVDVVNRQNFSSNWGDDARVARGSDAIQTELTALSQDFSAFVLEPVPEVGCNVPDC
jgi:hypothetical protein